MTQTLHPLYGDYITDAWVARAIPGPAGVYEGMDPSVTGPGGASGWTATLGVGKWRTRGDVEHGRYMIEETESTVVDVEAPDSVYPRIDLVIGIHGWVPGPEVPGTLSPSGEFSDAQRATYAVLAGVPAENPTEPFVADPYQSGEEGEKRAVIMASITIPAAGSPDPPVITRRNDLRFSSFADARDEVVAGRGGVYPAIGDRMQALEADKHNRVGDETHLGGFFRVAQGPTHVEDVVRLGDIDRLAPSVDLKNRIAIGNGAIQHGGIIPLPFYRDGTQAKADEVWSAPFVSVNSIQFGAGEHDTTLVIETSVAMPTRQVTARTRLVAGGGSYTRAYNGWANYQIICTREFAIPLTFGYAEGAFGDLLGAATGANALPVFSGPMVGSLNAPGGSANGSFT